MASPNISFDLIPPSIRKPGDYFEFNTKLAVRTLPGNLQKVLIVGQRLASGTVDALTPVDVFDDDTAAVYFGRGSIAHLMVREAITANPYVQLTAIAVDDDEAAVVATGKVTFTGAATSVGVASVYIAGVRVNVAVDNGDAIADIAAAVAAAVGNMPDLPVTASAALGVVTLTAKNKGLAGNSIVISAGTTATGVTVATTAFSAGDVDPDLAPAFAAVFAAWYNIVAIPFATTEALTALRTHLESVGSPMEQRDAIGTAGIPTTLAAATTLATANNSGLISLAWHSGSTKSAGEIAAGYASVIASEEDPARPLNTLEIAGLDVTGLTDQPSRTEQENALHNGVTPLTVSADGRVSIVRAITTYTVNPAGVEDIALLDLTTMRIYHYVRKAMRERVALRFPREKLSDKTPPKVRSELLDVATKCEELEILEHVEENKDALICERDLQDPNRLNAKIPADVVNGLHVFAGRIDLLL